MLLCRNGFESSMPLVFASSKLIYQAHVPRCGGTAVENYLHVRFGPLGLLDRQHLKNPAYYSWSQTSPQHIDHKSLGKLIPDSWVSHRFAVVRHPEDRIMSVYLFQRDIEGSIPADQSFQDWLLGVEDGWKSTPFLHDNHPRPADDLVPTSAKIFRLEDGLDEIVTWFDVLEGAKRGPRTIAKANGYQTRLEFAGLPMGEPPDITPDVRRLIERIYSCDYKRFGYPYRSEGTDADIGT